jgi:hypothetical protein
MTNLDKLDKESLLAEIARLNDYIKNLELQLFSFYKERDGDDQKSFETGYQKSQFEEVQK